MSNIDQLLMASCTKQFRPQTAWLSSKSFIIFVWLLWIPTTLEDGPMLKTAEFDFHCPLVENFQSYHKVVVMWTLNNAIWLKIDGGEVATFKSLSTHEKIENLADDYADLKFYRIQLNDGRYTFNYDERIGNFTMHIENGKPEDAGTWACYVTLCKEEDCRKEAIELEDYKDFLVDGESDFTQWPKAISIADDDMPPDELPFLFTNDGAGEYNNTASATFSTLVPLFLIPTVIVFKSF